MYVYEYGGNWTLQQTLQAFSVQGFGQAVSYSADSTQLSVGSLNNDGRETRLSLIAFLMYNLCPYVLLGVYVHKYLTGLWSMQQTISDRTCPLFGSSFSYAADGTQLAVGAYGAYNSNSGINTVSIF